MKYISTGYYTGYYVGRITNRSFISDGEYLVIRLENGYFKWRRYSKKFVATNQKQWNDYYLFYREHLVGVDEMDRTNYFDVFELDDIDKLSANKIYDKIDKYFNIGIC